MAESSEPNHMESNDGESLLGRTWGEDIIDLSNTKLEEALTSPQR